MLINEEPKTLDDYFNANVSELFGQVVEVINKGEKGIYDVLVVSILTVKDVLAHLAVQEYGDDEKLMPVELRNLGYYSEQCLAQFAHLYLQHKQKPTILTGAE